MGHFDVLISCMYHGVSTGVCHWQTSLVPTFMWRPGNIKPFPCRHGQYMSPPPTTTTTGRHSWPLTPDQALWSRPVTPVVSVPLAEHARSHAEHDPRSRTGQEVKGSKIKQQPLTIVSSGGGGFMWLLTHGNSTWSTFSIKVLYIGLAFPHCVRVWQLCVDFMHFTMGDVPSLSTHHLPVLTVVSVGVITRRFLQMTSQ